MDDKDQFVSGLTVGPSCLIDGRKHGRRKQRFTLFHAALEMINSGPKNKSRKNKTSIKRKDDKINGNKNNNGKNTEGWKKLVGSLRPLHMQTSRSASSSPQHSEYSDSALSCPLPTTASRISSTSSYPSPNNNLQEFENMGTMSTSVSSPNNFQELASTGSSGTMSPGVSPTNLQELASTGSTCTTSPKVSPNNLPELASTGSSGTMSPSVTTDNLQEVEGTMSHSVSNDNVADLARASRRKNHSLSSGKLGGLGNRKGKMGSSKSTSNLQDLSSDKMRPYKSALNLHDLDLNEEIEVEEDSDDRLLENLRADTLIDVKADEFIKKFYQEMKSQHKENVRHRPRH
ncbi:hypothetical protein POM88_022819 [Heracleum sosnowskyi]|uniref:Uncharacterized protein n=1 Tax=Heracleum sosnowskyi TaxID=360622 RepID=A0AAD8MU13_9APIA|nr:hypothetical protein POM88_022819 [Heracleum sosnowskyi]